MKYGGSVKKEGVAVSVILGLLLAGVLSFAVFAFDDLRARKTRTAPLPTSDSAQGGRPDDPHPEGSRRMGIPKAGKEDGSYGRKPGRG